MSDLAGDVERERKYQARVKRADDFKRWPISANAEKGISDEIEQRKFKPDFLNLECDRCPKYDCCKSQVIRIRGLSAKQHQLFFLVKGYRRHEKDNEQTIKDIIELINEGVTLPPGINPDRWHEISRDERTGNGVK